MSYEVRTPLLTESVTVLRSVIAGLQNGSVDGPNASRLISAARGLQSAVANDIKARLAAPRIAAYEAKLVEESRSDRRALEQRAAKA